MSTPYFVSGNEQLKLEIKDCNAHVIININGQQALKAEKKDVPAKIVLTKGLKRSDKQAIHHVQIQLWNKVPGHAIDVAVYSTANGLEEQPIKVFKEDKSVTLTEEANITDYYLALVSPSGPIG